MALMGQLRGSDHAPRSSDLAVPDPCERDELFREQLDRVDAVINPMTFTFMQPLE